MDSIEKVDVRLAADGSLPWVHLRVGTLCHSSFRLVLRDAGGYGEMFAQGALAENPQEHPDEHQVNFKQKPLVRAGQLDGCTLSALISFAAPCDSPTHAVDLAAYLTQDGKYLPNGMIAYAGEFLDVGGIVLRFRLRAR